MSKSTSRFIWNKELWKEITNCAASSQPVFAAMAYVGRDGAKLLPLKRGDSVVVDMSLSAVRQGVTYPRALKPLCGVGF